MKVWTHVQDEPVIALGPEAYDRHAVALNQVVRYKGRYYGVYHANADPEWKGPWTTCLAVSDDLVRWEKYPGNPVIRSDDSSGILVADGRRHRCTRGEALAAPRHARSPPPGEIRGGRLALHAPAGWMTANGLAHYRGSTTSSASTRSAPTGAPRWATR
jgi:hypothetical protein